MNIETLKPGGFLGNFLGPFIKVSFPLLEKCSPTISQPLPLALTKEAAGAEVYKKS